MKDTINPGIEIVMPAPVFQKAVKQKATNVARIKQILENEYNAWDERRKYVKENMWKLKDREFPIKVTALTDIGDPYNCIVLNDMEMLSYDEVFEVIKDIENKIEKENKKNGIEITD